MHHADPRRLDTAWFGLGGYLGAPDLVGIFSTARFGPVVGGVGVLPLLVVDVGDARLELGAGRYDYARRRWQPTAELSFGAEFGGSLADR